MTSPDQPEQSMTDCHHLDIERGLRAVLDELRMKSFDGRIMDVNYPLSNLPRLVEIFQKAAKNDRQL